MSGSIDDTFQISQSRLYFLSLNTQLHTCDKMNHNLLSYRRFDIWEYKSLCCRNHRCTKHADFLSFSVFLYNAILVIFTLFIISVIFAVSSPSSSVLFKSAVFPFSQSTIILQLLHKTVCRTILPVEPPLEHSIFSL
jgi:hypothetical protein